METTLTSESGIGTKAILALTAIIALTTVLAGSLALNSPSSTSSAEPQAEVRGVSIATTAFGTTQISSSLDGVDVHVLDSAQEGSAIIGLAKEGQVVATGALDNSQRVRLDTAAPGNYEVWAITTTTEEVTDGDIRLAPAQRIDRLGHATID